MRRRLFLWVLAVSAAGVNWPGTGLTQQAEEQAVLNIVFRAADETQTAQRAFGLRDIQALPTASFRTSTVWTDGVHQFKGVWLSDLMAHLGITEGTIKFSALNDYHVEIPLADMVPGGPLLAYEQDGALMSTRDKGPLWIVFPYDSHQKFQTESVYAQSIWQMDRIDVYR